MLNNHRFLFNPFIINKLIVIVYDITIYTFGISILYFIQSLDRGYLCKFLFL